MGLQHIMQLTMEIHILLNLMITGSIKITKTYHIQELLQLNIFLGIFIFHPMVVFTKRIQILI